MKLNLIWKWAFIMFFFMAVLFSTSVSAQNAGDYRTSGSGAWHNNSIWKTYDGSSWVAAAIPPSSADGSITIVMGDSVYITANITIDQTCVDSGAVLLIQSGVTVTVNNGADDDLRVNGTFHVQGNLSYTGSTNETTGLMV